MHSLFGMCWGSRRCWCWKWMDSWSWSVPFAFGAPSVPWKAPECILIFAEALVMSIFFFFTAEPAAIFKAQKNETSVAYWELLNANTLLQIRHPASCSPGPLSMLSPVKTLLFKDKTQFLCHTRGMMLSSPPLPCLFCWHITRQLSVSGVKHVCIYLPTFLLPSPHWLKSLRVSVSLSQSEERTVSASSGVPSIQLLVFLFRRTPPWEHILRGKEWAWIVSKIEISARAALWTNERELSKAGARSNF